MEKYEVSIEYCTPCNYTSRALSLMEELLNKYTPAIASLKLIPSGGGLFEVVVGEELVFSKKAIGRHAEEGEIARLFEEKTGASPVEK